jgi:hypothetical protein
VGLGTARCRWVLDGHTRFQWLGLGTVEHREATGGHTGVRNSAWS